jgi:hypothetical protein
MGNLYLCNGLNRVVLEHTGSSWNPPIYPLKAALFVGIILIFVAGTKWINSEHIFYKI